jgi:hypothetical protein
MNADIGFGWIVFVGFLFWLLQVLRAGATGGSGRRPAPPPSHPPRPDATQGEGEQLEQLLRHLEGRLGQGVPEPRPRPKTTVVVRRPAPPQRPRAQPAAPRRDAGQPEGVSLEAPVDREAEAEAIERRRDAAVAARSQALTDADHAVFEARIDADRAAAAANAPAGSLTPHRLREAVVWSEILGLPAGLRE